MANELVDAIDKIGTQFEQFKTINDQRLEEERKGNVARAQELSATLDKISADLSQSAKDKTVLEKRLAAYADRVEILEALNDRPRGTVQDRIRSEHKDLFVKWVRSGGKDQHALTAYAELQQKAREVKDVTIGTTTAGGFALPEEIGTLIDKLMLRNSAIVGEVRNIQVGSSDYKELVTIHGGTSAWAGETSTRTATGTPNLRERAPTWGELYAYPQVSNWALQDIFFNVAEWLTDDIADGMSVGLSTAIFSGNGSNKPTGMTNTAPVTTDDYASPLRAAAAYEYIPISSPSSPQATNGITAGTVIDLVYLLNPKYRAGAKFAWNTITQGHVRKFKDTTGQYLWQPSLQAGQPDTLLGYPAFTWEDMGNPTTANAYPIAFGNFKRGYLLTTRTELEMTREDITNPGYTRFYVRRRFGGCPLNNDAVKFTKVED